MGCNEEKINFCVRYLVANGVNVERFVEIASNLPRDPVGTFELKKQQGYTFYIEVAKGLHDMWPPGMKDGKWAWRDSVPTLAERLKFIWERMGLEDEYTVEQCLEAGRKYLNQFENKSVKYMQILKYFVFKQKDAGTTENGIIKKTYESTLIKILQDTKEEDKIESLEDFII